MLYLLSTLIFPLIFTPFALSPYTCLSELPPPPAADLERQLPVK